MASEFGVDPALIVGQIEAESGWQPQIKNPNSTARGLIQFLDATAQGMGFDGSLDLVTQYPDIDSQLSGPVTQYWRMYAPYSNDNEFVLAVLLPALRKKPLDTVLSASIQAANPGISTLGDYVNYVKSKLSAFAVVKDFLTSEDGGISLGLLLLVGVGFMVLRK
jgi:hypothetical protein